MPIPPWKKRLPNLITYSRIALVPFIIWCLILNTALSGYIAAALFILGSITDYLDGSLARKYKVQSVIGQFMDPIADKIFVSSTLVMLIPSGRFDAVMVIILLARDTFIGGLRSIAATQNIVIAAGTMGKWKTAIQMIAIPFVLIRTPIWGIPVFEIGYYVLWLTVILSLVSGFQYLRGYAQKASLS